MVNDAYLFCLFRTICHNSRGDEHTHRGVGNPKTERWGGLKVVINVEQCIYLYILCIYFLYSVNMIIKWYDDNKIKA